MAPIPQCPALANAMKSKGVYTVLFILVPAERRSLGMSYGDIAGKMGKDEAFVAGCMYSAS